jgi:hypothetical protein
MTRPTQFDISPKAKVYRLPSANNPIVQHDSYNEGYHAGVTTGLIFGVWLGALATCTFALLWSFFR